MNGPAVLTVQELAHELRVGRNAAYGLVSPNGGPIFAIKVGRSIRVPRAAVERYLAGEPQAVPGPEGGR